MRSKQQTERKFGNAAGSRVPSRADFESRVARDVTISGSSMAVARRELARRASRVLEGSRAEERQVARLSMPVRDVEPLAWLRGQRAYPKIHWLGRDDGFEVAAAGAADVRENIPANARARYFGGMRFDPGVEAGEDWKAFGAGRFVLPRFELHPRADASGGSVLVVNLMLPHDADRREEVLEEIAALEEPREGLFVPTPVSREDEPGLSAWKSGVERALSEFGSGRLGKVVLARRSRFLFGEKPDPLDFAEGLREAAPGCFRFYVEPERGTAFFGASPERLFRREGRDMVSEAVAGTRPRGESDADDEELRQELLSSQKDLSEHAFVRESIRENLGGLCERLEVDSQPSEMKLAQGRHLLSRVKGTLREDVTDSEALAALHPTPAVGGYPKEEALEVIRTLEPFDRGWYAGPVGWVGADEAEFAVGIRSGVARGRELALFFGNGVVPGSTPAGEWAELEQKLAGFTKALGLERSHDERSSRHAAP